MWPPAEFNNHNIRNNNKVDAVSKLQVINALDSGQSKTEVAKQFGVHPTIISYIYRQKEFLTKTYKEKLETSVQDVRSTNLDLLLLDWFETNIKEGHFISKEELIAKAFEILGPASEEFLDLLEWLKMFRSRHHIVSYSLNAADDTTTEEWAEVLSYYSEDRVYVGGTCALSHDLEVDSYFNGCKPSSYVSIMLVTNASGSDRRPLLVVGQEPIDKDETIQSLPLKYYTQNKSNLICFSALQKYLLEWDIELKAVEHTIALVLDVPSELYQHINLSNIKLIQLRNMNWISESIEKIAHCFRFNYRKTQITKRCLFPSEPTTLIKCLQMMSYSWHCLNVNLIRHLFYPPCKTNLLIINDKNKDVKMKKLSLSEWSQSTTLPLQFDKVGSKLDGFVTCDSDLQSLSRVVTSNFLENETCNEKPLSVADAFQAMRRLTMYMQGESAKDAIIKSAKDVENYVEYNLLLELKQKAAVYETWRSTTEEKNTK